MPHHAEAALYSAQWDRGDGREGEGLCGSLVLIEEGERDYDGRLSNGARPPILHHLLQKRDGY